MGASNVWAANTVCSPYLRSVEEDPQRFLGTRLLPRGRLQDNHRGEANCLQILGACASQIPFGGETAARLMHMPLLCFTSKL